MGIGILFGLFVIWFSELEYFNSALEDIKSRLDQFVLSNPLIIFLSIAAGFGEEIFFRAALQPLVGIFIAAVFFVLIHGYLSFKNMKLNLFGSLLILFIVFLGWAAREFSIWLAIAGHFSYDLVLLYYYKNFK